MSTGTLIAIIVPAAVVLIILAVAFWMLLRRRRLQERFGPEYDRTLEQQDSRLAAEQELRARLMRERGYPADGFQQQLADLSVEHARTLEHYRAAHEFSVRSSGGQATTEELRGAMVHYRALFEELLTDQGGGPPHGGS